MMSLRTADEFKAALMTNFSTHNVFVGVGKSSERKLPLPTLEKIHSNHDFEFDLDNNIITVWRQYGIGVGKEISYCYPTDLSSRGECEMDYSYDTIMSGTTKETRKRAIGQLYA